jgi:beta-lysine N6-acetyltransferase
MDKLEKIGKSLLQHGKYNNRIYVMDIYNEDILNILVRIDELIKEHSYKKIIAVVPESLAKVFFEKKFEVEVEIPEFFNGKEKGLFLVKYVDLLRKTCHIKVKQKIDEVLDTAREKKIIIQKPKKLDEFIVRNLDESDADELAKIYRKVFESYPFPIYEKDYILKTMKNNVRYFGVFIGGALVSASSAEMHIDRGNVEMTDFATDPDFLGNGLALILLDKMEQVLKGQSLKTFYTIARALSFGMNITFAKMDYKYAGTLINNTNICGKIESMNVWYKKVK